MMKLCEIVKTVAGKNCIVTTKNLYPIGCLLLTLISSACARTALDESAIAASPFAVGASTIQPIKTTSPTRSPSTSATTSPPGGSASSPIPVVPVETKPDKQIYIDPAGWYAILIPAEWQPDDSQAVFWGETGFFKTGYLPEMMFMRNALDVCQWLANIDSPSTYAVSWSSEHGGCILTSLPEVTPAIIQEIVENPAADVPQRFLYFKTDAEHFREIANTFVWLQPFDSSTEPAYHLMPLRPEDMAFWENSGPVPDGFSIQEFPLTGAAQGESPSSIVFNEFIPPDAPRVERTSGAVVASATWQEIQEKIQPFGYELRPTSQYYLRQLYRDGILQLDNIYDMPKIFTFSTSEDPRIAFIVHKLIDPSQSPYIQDNVLGYLILDDSITKWEDGPRNPMDPELPPILYKENPLWVGVAESTMVQVRNSLGEVQFSFATYYITHLPIHGFKAWNDHWILEVSDFVIQDGEILNEKFSFEEVFGWRLMNDKPFYFFRKGPRVGISYNGQFLPLYYHEVAHGFCCGYASNNPIGDEVSVRFFGGRDGLWYYVLVRMD